MELLQQRRLRHAVIGVAAGIFKSHRPALELPEVELVAVVDINVEEGRQRAQEYHCAFYEDYHVMLAETKPDVVVILTPPYLHATMTIDCLQAGCHVLLEKPIAVQVSEADAMIEAAEQSGRLLGVIFQHHYRPEIGAARKMLREGVLGDIQRVDLFATWTRPDSYYRMADWRATWSGEGGGVLTNQASHNLDLLCNLIGQPARVYAWTRRLLHKIETEDTAHAMVEWENGALGFIHISTAEADVSEYIKVIGTKGSMEIGRNTLAASRLEQDMKEYRTSSQHPYEQPRVHPYSVAWKPGKGDHVAVYTKFLRAVLDGKEFYATGIQARMELELANAIIYSSYRHQEVEFPLDRQSYSTLLAQLRRQDQ